MIKLKPIDESNYRECVKLNVKQHQREYVGLPEQDLRIYKRRN